MVGLAAHLVFEAALTAAAMLPASLNQQLLLGLAFSCRCHLPAFTAVSLAVHLAMQQLASLRDSTRCRAFVHNLSSCSPRISAGMR